MKLAARLHWVRSDLGDLLAYAAKNMAEDVAMDIGYRRSQGERFATARSLAGQAVWFAKAAWCCFADHDYVDESCVGPESGRETVSCGRCGKTIVDHIYY